MDEGAPPIDAAELLKHAEWIHRLAHALVQPDNADDLAQDVFLAAIERPPPAGASHGGWLAGVTRNLARLRWRARKRREHYEAQSTVDDQVPDPEALVERAEAHQLLTKLLLQLDEPLRSTLLLRFYEGLSSAEIARRLRVPAGTVRWRLKRALDELRARLDEASRGGKRHWALLLSPLQGTPVSSTIAQGVLLMKAVKLGIGIVVALLLAWFGVHELRRPSVPAAETTGAVHTSGRKGVESTAVLPMRAAESRRDADPAGALRLEGQVIDEQEMPVAAAEVALAANPPRFTRSGQDGSFVFERLIGRDYRVEARSGDGYASSVELRLTPSTEPVILRIRRGGTVEVVVRDGANGSAISGAAVELRSTLTWQALTDESGRARLAGVGPGWPSLHVSASGHAPAAMILRTSGDPRHSQEQIVSLAHGASVSGRVVDERGTPVAGVRVAAEATSEPFPVLDAVRDGVLSGADGRWRFDALAGGSYRFLAFHESFAPAATAPIALDGEHPLDRVEIRLGPGATVRGRVINDGGQPVASALVRVLTRGSLPWRSKDEAYTDAVGRFVLKGLSPRQVDLSASSADGSSDLVPIDLATASQRDVTLTISIHGVIEGTVASTNGAPSPEARVLAEPARTGALGERQAWEARGIGAVLADGGGHFRFVGLPPGDYRLRAARPGASDDALWMAPPVPATVGDRDVRLAVPADGQVRGKVVYRDGGSPELFRVEMDAVRPEPFSATNGVFEIGAPGGKHDLVVTGPTFQRTRMPSVDVKEGSTTDLGSIIVDKGRSISGHVLDGSGAPVAGATVAGGLLLTGNGSQLNLASEGYRVQETESDGAGRYVLRGFGEDPLVLVAGRDGVGRSASVRIARGPSSVEVDLVLQPTGSLSGKVTRDGRPVPQVVVIANPRGARSSNFFVMTGDDGSYAFDTLAAGDYVVFPIIGGGNIQPKDMFFSAVTVSPGQRTTADLAARYGSSATTVRVTSSGPNGVPAALVFLVAGAVNAPNMESMLEGTWLPTGGRIVPAYLRWAVGAAGARFEGLLPGTYSACAVPLPVDPNDRAAITAVRDQVNSFPMTCATAAVTDGSNAPVAVHLGK